MSFSVEVGVYRYNVNEILSIESSDTPSVPLIVSDFGGLTTRRQTSTDER